MDYRKPGILHYRIAQAAAWLVTKLVFKRKILRNELKGKRGPFVVIANHETALDFVNLIGLTRFPMNFVISKSFFSTLPIKGFMTRMGVIPKQQFQTTVKDMKMMKRVVDAGGGLVIYPAGLMCEDGLSTPIPAATYKFLKWLGVDVYVARASGTYFVMPKWAKGIRPGRTYMDVYKLFDRENLKKLTVDEIREKTDEALLFDAYREQETLQVPYKGGEQIQGLENVLYLCPNCKAEFTVENKNGNSMCCSHCGYEVTADAMGFLHNHKQLGPQMRYVSDWSRMIGEHIRSQIQEGQLQTLSAPVRIQTVDDRKNKFVDAGQGVLTLQAEGFRLEGQLGGEELSLSVAIGNVPALPFSPGKHLELQHGSDIYRCLPEDGRIVMKFINMLKCFHGLETGVMVEE